MAAYLNPQDVIDTRRNFYRDVAVIGGLIPSSIEYSADVMATAYDDPDFAVACALVLSRHPSAEAVMRKVLLKALAAVARRAAEELAEGEAIGIAADDLDTEAARILAQ